jgi:hypothetical protein
VILTVSAVIALSEVLVDASNGSTHDAIRRVLEGLEPIASPTVEQPR